MPRLFVFTAGDDDARRHVQQSVANPVPRQTILGASPPEHHEPLLAIETNAGGFYAWGAIPGERNTPTWEAMEIGDVILCVFAARYRYAGRVVGKYHNQAVARAIWQTNELGKTWELLYFFTKQIEIDVPLGDVMEDLNARYWGFTRISAQKLHRIDAKYDDLETFLRDRLGAQLSVEVGISHAQFAEAVSELVHQGPLDQVREVLVRTEQSFLRAYLFGDRHTGECKICGQIFPVELLVAAHLKRRADCSEEERLDYTRNVMAMCGFGCDDLFERGFIGVLDGCIVVNSVRRLSTTPAVAQHLSTIDGRTCDHWSAGQQYFNWHAEHHGLLD